MQSSGLDGRIPVFVFPQALTFYVADQSTHKQILTLYNPYDFRLGFTVLCNNPVCFDVEPSNGVVFAKCSVDIIVTRSNISLNDARERDCLRVVVSEEGTKQVLGKKDILSTLQPGSPSPSSDVGKFESVRGQVRHGVGDSQDLRFGSNPQQQPFGTGHPYAGPSLLLVAGAALCVIGLLLPTMGEDESTTVPFYLHLSSNIKIVLAYALGLLTYAILKPM